MRLNSRHLAAVEYGSDVEGNDGKRVTLRRGVNELSDEDFSFLNASPSFRKHAKAGTFVVLEDPPAPSPVVAPPATPAPGSERDRKPGEGDKAYAKRMAALDDAEAKRVAAEKADADKKAAANKELLDAYNALPDEATKTAMYGTLTDEQKALIDGQAKA